MCNGFVGGHRVIPGTNPLHDIDVVRHEYGIDVVNVLLMVVRYVDL